MIPTEKLGRASQARLSGGPVKKITLFLGGPKNLWEKKLREPNNFGDKQNLKSRKRTKIRYSY